MAAYTSLIPSGERPVGDLWLLQALIFLFPCLICTTRLVAGYSVLSANRFSRNTRLTECSSFSIIQRLVLQLLYTFVSFRNFIFGHQKVDIRFTHRYYPTSYRLHPEHPTVSSKTREACQRTRPFYRNMCFHVNCVNFGGFVSAYRLQHVVRAKEYKVVIFSLPSRPTFRSSHASLPLY